MKIERQLSDEAVLVELGGRMAQCRLDLQLTQAQVADQAGIAKRTVERIESGQSTQLSSLIRVLRVLDLLDALESLVPEVGPRPLDLLKLKKKVRKRASRKRNQDDQKPWQWGDEQ